MKKIILLTSLLIALTSSYAATQTNNSQNTQNQALYHGYQGQQYVADSDNSTQAYIPVKRAEELRPFRFKVFVPGLFIGRFGATIDYKLNPAFSVGVVYRTWSDTGTDTGSYNPNTEQFGTINYKDFYNKYGLNFEYAVNGNLNMSGWVLNPRLTRSDYRFHDGFGTDDSSKENVTQHSTNASLFLMHQWAWPTGIYMQLGIGAEYVSNPNSNLLSLTNSHFGGDWDYTLGYQF